MKLKKTAALVLSLFITFSAAGCSYKTAGTTPATTPALTAESTDSKPKTQSGTETSESEPVPETFAEKPAADVVDAEGDKLVIWSFDSNFKKLLEKYSTVKDYEYVVVGRDEYYRRLDEAFESDSAPDLFICGFDHVKAYADSDKTASINSIGISNKACETMYDYSLRMACDSYGNIKGLAWDLSPSAVFYQRTLAQQYLGSSDPAEVSKSFSSWAAFLTAARKINKESDGTVKITAGTGEIFRSYIGNRSTPWKVGDKLQTDATVESFYEYARTLNTEKLTFGASTGSDEWKAGMRNKTVLSYWGPVSLARTEAFALDPVYFRKANPTSGDWGIVQAPESFAWGGDWIMVTSASDMKKSCADIMTSVCCVQDNLKDMMAGGMAGFVNSKTVIGAAKTDERYNFAWLGGQNPYTILAPVAESIKAGPADPDDARIKEIYSRTVNVYANGGFGSVKDAIATFRELLIETKIVKE